MKFFSGEFTCENVLVYWVGWIGKETYFPFAFIFQEVAQLLIIIIVSQLNGMIICLIVYYIPSVRTTIYLVTSPKFRVLISTSNEEFEKFLLTFLFALRTFTLRLLIESLRKIYFFIFHFVREDRTTLLLLIIVVAGRYVGNSRCLVKELFQVIRKCIMSFR